MFMGLQIDDISPDSTQPIKDRFTSINLYAHIVFIIAFKLNKAF